MKKFEQYSNSKFRRVFIVEGITDETDEEILDFCDRNNFGGWVRRRGDGTAQVECYID